MTTMRESERKPIDEYLDLLAAFPELPQKQCEDCIQRLSSWSSTDPWMVELCECLAKKRLFDVGGTREDAEAFVSSLFHRMFGERFEAAQALADAVAAEGRGSRYCVWVYIEAQAASGDEYHDIGPPDPIALLSTESKARAFVRSLPGWHPQGSDNRLGVQFEFDDDGRLFSKGE